MRIVSVASAFPSHRYPQAELLDLLEQNWPDRAVGRRLRQIGRNSQVAYRHLALPKERYLSLGDFTERNRLYQQVATDLGARALARALNEAKLAPQELRHIFFVSVTGMATPSIDARLVGKLGLSRNVRRTPIFGLGCVAGAAGLARAWDAVRREPGGNAALVSVELCSLTWQAGDSSAPNLVASSLFGDGAAALVLRAEEDGSAGPEVLASKSILYENTEKVMGWEIGAHGLKIELSPEIPQIVEAHLRSDVDIFLGEHGLNRHGVHSWILHTGGPRILEAFERTLNLPEGALAASWASLAETGNLSSASVLVVLEKFFKQQRPPAGAISVLLAMGPGFCSEMVLLRW